MKCGVLDDDVDTNIAELFPITNDYIDRAIEDGGCVFVHCLEGKSRSICVCLAYMVGVLGYDFDETLERISKIRNIDIFPLYLSQTKAYCSQRSTMKAKASLAVQK
jgi:protein-tyrosine phosphatase